jgi:hypothetical protein
MSKNKRTSSQVTLSLLLCLLSTGCEHIAPVGNALYDPVLATNVVATPTGQYALVTTNGWTLKPVVAEGIELAGDVAPFPWAGLAANAVLAALGVGAHLRSRQWKKAAISGVSAAQTFKRELKQLDSVKAQAAKENVVREQRTNGTQAIVQTILNKFV